VNRIFWK